MSNGIPVPAFYGTSSQSVNAGSTATLTGMTVTSPMIAFNPGTGTITAPFPCVVVVRVGVVLPIAGAATLLVGTLSDTVASGIKLITMATMTTVVSLAMGERVTLQVKAESGTITVKYLSIDLRV